MNRKRLITVAALAVLALPCSETVGGMMQDAGAMLADTGDMMQPDAGAQDVSASSDKSDTPEGGYTYYWSEFPINTPGETEVTVCYRGDPEGVAHWKRGNCYRSIASWFDRSHAGDETHSPAMHTQP
jgi:hypothetical protein